ncbi:PREDICTED: uncharacterized protein LOC105148684 [Acromyrmex echinatior]|uniref:Uncharacterized protein n=1 Tax=Acromyrmex echinatior TaxID=103372 RepID=F4WSK7_ACREC|nr:PREDICTED: uncharacterized protein LOC105148684 [Acromyrmex echinatior]EGI62822.1 hypothetical protein G5I_08817 [Acromyrmex echinatior]
MRDTNDMMEDALSEDTMMDCGGDSGEDSGGLEDFVNLSTNITDNSRTIQDAAERLLTLLGMDEDDEDLLSSEEDEGVEVDIDEEDDEETDNTKLLHQLAASLAQELKYSQKQSSSSRAAYQDQNTMHSVEMLQDTSYLGRGCLQDQVDHPKTSVRQNNFGHGDLDFFDDLDEQNANFTKFTNFENFRQEPRGRTLDSSSLDHRLWTDDSAATQAAGKSFNNQQEQNPDSWTAGWDACATEALRYLVEDEGLPLHHPTVVAMKNHLDLQRERAFIQYTGYTDNKSQDMSLLLD